MQIQRKTGAIILTVAMALGVGVGMATSRTMGNEASADSEQSFKVDRQTLSELYGAIFNRPLDAGADAHVGRDLKTVLRDLSNSDEHRYYNALFKAVKAYEEAVRAPGDLTAGDKQAYLSTIDSALATLVAWVETLPTQPICDGITTSEDARQAILAAYARISAQAKDHAQNSEFTDQKRIGTADNLPLPIMRCLHALISSSPSASPTATVNH